MKTLSILIAAMVGALASAGADSTPMVTNSASSPVLVRSAATSRRMAAWQRAQSAYEQRAFPLGEIPEDAHARAHVQIKLAGEARAFRAAASSPEPVKVWRNIGPAPAFVGRAPNQSPPINIAGRVASIAVDPGDLTHWLLAAATGGIWETHDSGSLWIPRTDNQPSLAMGAIAFAPSNPSIVYAGTGEASLRGDAFAGAGLLMSRDGGSTWGLIASSNFLRASFSQLAVDPAQPAVVIAATTRGMAGRFSDRLPRGNLLPGVPPRGILKSSDGGTNWSLRLEGEATSIGISPEDFTRQYACLGEPFGASSNGVYRSLDAGETWFRMSGPWGTNGAGLGRARLAVAPSNPDVLYVSIATPVGPDLLGGDNLVGIWKTTNAWSAEPTWTALPQPTAALDSLWYHQAISVDPKNANILYLGSIQLYRFGGAQWSEIAGNIYVASSTPKLHGDIHALVWADNRLIVGDDGGVWSSTNRFLTATNHNATLSTIQFYAGSLHPSNPERALAGPQDHGLFTWMGSNTWEQIEFGGDVIATSFSRLKPDTHWAATHQWLKIFRTTNGGGAFQETEGGLPAQTATSDQQFAAPLEHSPVADDVFVAGLDRLWKCTNFFSTGSPLWRQNSPGLTRTNGGHVSGLPVSTAAFAAGDATGNTYAYAHENGILRLTKDGGTTWTDPDPDNAVPDRYVTKLAFDPRDTNVLYVALSGFDEGTPGQPGHLFKTTNAMAPNPAWQDISPPVNLPNDCVTMDPSDPTSLWVGTDIGLWQSSDGGASWTHHGPELRMPNVPVFDLQINPATGRIVAFTHGRGAFSLELVPPTADLALTQASEPPVATPDCDFTQVLTVQNDGPVAATGVVLSNPLPAGATFVSVSASQGSCVLAGGVVTCELGTLRAFYGNATVRLTLRQVSAGQMTNHFAVTANEPDAVPAHRTSTQIIPVSFFTQGPQNFAVRPGGQITNSVAVAGCHPLTYQWNFNGVPIPDQTDATLILTNIQLAQEGNYTVTASDGTHTMTSEPGRLAVLIDPVITVAPVSQSVVAGGSVTFSVAFTGNPMPFGVEWRQGSNTKASNTVSRLQDFFTLTNAQLSQAGTWRVIVRNPARNTTTGDNRTFTLTVLPDIDGDGLPDAWELVYGFPTNSAANAVLDDDGDGLTNWQEYQAGTNPTNAMSYLKVESVSLADDGSAVRLTFFATSNNTYTVESRLAADAGAWQRVVDVVATSTNRVVEILDRAVPGANRQRYYRLVTPRVP